MSRNDRAEVDRFLSDDSKWQESLEMSKQATNAGRALDGEMKLAYSHEEYIKMEKVLYSSWIDYYKQHQWNTLADNFENILTRCEIATDTQWLNYLRNRNVPDGLKKEIAATFFNCIQSGIDEERKLPETEEEIEFYLVKKQAQSGDPNAMVTLSKMYLQGNGCYRDKEEALIWLKKAAKAGNAEAKLILDEIRLKGVERPLRRRRTIESNNKQEHDNKQDQEKKFQEEKKENDPKHWLKLANDTRRAGNYEEAISYYKRAIELGSTEAKGALSGLERMLNQKRIPEFIQRGDEFRENNNYPKAIEYYEKAAEAGNFDRAFVLAHLYRFELKDDFKAFKWYQKAAELGDPRSMYIVGVDYEHGRGTEENLTKAFDWVQKSADLGFVKAISKLGEFYCFGIGTEKNVARAVQLWEKAIEAGEDNLTVIENLGWIYFTGVVSERDSKKAFKMFLKMAIAGSSQSMFRVSLMYRVGDGIDQDYDKAFYWMSKAAEQGNLYALDSLGKMYFEGTGVEKNFNKAIECYEKAIKLGGSEAEETLKESLRNIKQGYKILVTLADKYHKGEFGERNKQKALDLYLYAAQLAKPFKSDTITSDYGDISYKIAKIYYKGEVVEQNCIKAGEWYSEAVKDGHTWAMEELAELILEGKDNQRVRSYAKSLLEFKKLFDKACRGFPDAKFEVAYHCYYLDDNNFGFLDYRKAVAWFKDIVENGRHLQSKYDALCSMALLYEEGGYGLEKNEEKATSLREEAEETKKALDKQNEEIKAENARILAEKKRKSDNNPLGCFITTTVCKSLGKTDDCYELTTFRFFRDNWLVDQLDGASLIAEYYSIAPKIVDKINRLKNSGEIYQSIWDEWLSSCLKLIEQGRNEDCKIRYINMVNYLKKTFLAN